MSNKENLPELLREDALYHLDVAQQCDCDPKDTINYRHMQNSLHAADEIEILQISARELERENERLLAELSKVIHKDAGSKTPLGDYYPPI